LSGLIVVRPHFGQRYRWICLRPDHALPILCNLEPHSGQLFSIVNHLYFIKRAGLAILHPLRDAMRASIKTLFFANCLREYVRGFVVTPRITAFHFVYLHYFILRLYSTAQYLSIGFRKIFLALTRMKGD
jgi:hypothetical protein